jgi:hypothetical protein
MPVMPATRRSGPRAAIACRYHVPNAAEAEKLGIGEKAMTFTLDEALLQPIVALIAGILILIIPRILNYVVAIYLIFVGVIGLWPHLLSGISH